MRKTTLLLIFIFCSVILWAGSPADTAKIRATMDKQKNAWNQGNIEGFMAAYWKSDQFTFHGGAKQLKGWDQLLAMYKKNYAGEKMGTLDFTDIEIKIISADYAYVLGRWSVTVKDSKKEGLFTLIFRRFGKDWKIIHDHSS